MKRCFARATKPGGIMSRPCVGASGATAASARSVPVSPSATSGTGAGAGGPAVAGSATSSASGIGSSCVAGSAGGAPLARAGVPTSAAISSRTSAFSSFPLTSLTLSSGAGVVRASRNGLTSPSSPSMGAQRAGASAFEVAKASAENRTRLLPPPAGEEGPVLRSAYSTPTRRKRVCRGSPPKVALPCPSGVTGVAMIGTYFRVYSTSK